MKKIINDPGSVVAETLEGFLAAWGNKLEGVEGVKGIKVKNVKDKVAFVIGGGSGHEPLFSMFVGENLADASASGNIFTSPDPITIVKTASSVSKGKGILFVYGNYSGDNLNFDMAVEMLADMGIESRTVRVWDDVASAPADRINDRRGIAGDVFVIKVGGAATAAGLSLEEAYRVTAEARDNTFSVAMALSGATIPGEESASFFLPADKIEFGMGAHGEPGIWRMKVISADEMVDLMLDTVLMESGIKQGDKVCTLVNGMGSTTLAELYIMNRRLAVDLRNRGIDVYDMQVGSYLTTQEMAGASITLMKLNDKLKIFFDVPCRSPYYSKF